MLFLFFSKHLLHAHFHFFPCHIFACFLALTEQFNPIFHAHVLKAFSNFDDCLNRHQSNLYGERSLPAQQGRGMD